MKTITKVIPALVILILAIILILLPVRTIINKCHESQKVVRKETYETKFVEFTTDYDRENPVTKNQGLVRYMEKKIAMAESEEEKQALKNQMQGVKQASVADAFTSYSVQRSYMQSQMQAVTMPSYTVAYAMPTMGYSGYGYSPYSGGYYGSYPGYANYGVSPYYGYGGYGGYGTYGTYGVQYQQQTQPQA